MHKFTISFLYYQDEITLITEAIFAQANYAIYRQIRKICLIQFFTFETSLKYKYMYAIKS